jgi:hypothetical protein
MNHGHGHTSSLANHASGWYGQDPDAQEQQQQHHGDLSGQHYNTPTDAAALFSQSRKPSMQRAATVHDPSALDQIADVMLMQRATSGFLLHRGPSTVNRMSTTFLDEYGGINSQGGQGDTEIDVVTDHDPMLPDVSLEIDLEVS